MLPHKNNMKMFARHILLAALLLKARVPLGWMPDASGGSAFVICTADGGHSIPGHDDGAQHHQPCAFAAAHVMASPEAHVFAAPLLAAAILTRSVHPETAVARPAFTPQSPRAPPLNA